MTSAKELVIDRPSLGRVEESAATPIKSILFAVHEDDGLAARLQVALSLARACSAHIQLLQVIPLEAYTVVDSYGGNFVRGEIVEALQDQAAKLHRQLAEHLNKEDVNWSYEATTSAVLPELVKNAALADLVVIGRQPNWHEFRRTGPGLLGALICNTRAPLCIPGDGGEKLDPFGNAVIAWNGSIEGANAVRSTIGLLRMAAMVRVVRFAEDKETAFPDTSLMEYLSRHGVHAEMDRRSPKTEIGQDLVDFATRAGAEYIVMGGYSHTRAGEFLLGGLTREFLHACPISLVMAH